MSSTREDVSRSTPGVRRGLAPALLLLYCVSGAVADGRRFIKGPPEMLPTRIDMHSPWAKIFSLLTAIGLLSLGPSCTCEGSANGNEEAPSISSALGASAASADGSCCSDRDDDEHDDQSSHDCCGCDGHSSQAPRSLSDLGVGIAAGSDRLDESMPAPSSAAGLSAPWVRDFHRRTRRPSAASADADPARSPAAHRYLVLEVLRL
jgi:hypothetical protein